MSVDSYRNDEKSSNVSKIATLLRLYRYMLKYKFKIVLVLLIMGICVTISLSNPLIIEEAIDHYIKDRDMDGLIKLGIFAAVINIILVLLIKVRMYIMSKISNEILLVIRQDLYTHIQKLSFSFFDSRPTGKVLSRIIGDVNSLKDVLTNSVITLIPDFITVCAVVIIMMIKNYKLALAALISLPIMAVGIYCVQRFSHLRWRLFRKKSANVNAFIHEDLSGMRIIQSLTAEAETGETFDGLLTEHRNSFINAVKLNDSIGPIIDVCWGIGTLALYFAGIKLLGIDDASVGLLIAFGTYISMFWSPILNLSNFYNQLITNIAGAERIFEIMDTKPDITDSKDVKELPDIKGDIRFEHVTFAYDEDTVVLDDVSFSVKAGETIALVGPTGAGKTTIVNLISRFYDIQKGDIYVDNFNLKNISIESL
ncbi:MAG TPA: ABC transporter transmembrane domain-containing protein [Lachnospiraceae bacterium]|nr:ABC transporter transmembrane domain-containing protein [Lachnospiraceae bacterium]